MKITKDYYIAIKKDFRNFLFAVHKYLNLQTPTDLQYELANEIQHGSNRLLISAFRGCGKSHILACYCVWKLLNDQSEQILVVSATSQRAKAFSSFCQRLIMDMDCLKHLKPDDSKESWTKEMFTVKGAPVSQTASLTSVGLTSQITGKRATLICADDVESLQNSLNEDTRQSLLNATDEFESVIIPDRPNKIVFLGTPQSKNSIYNNIEEKGYIKKVWTSQVPKPNEIEYYGDSLANSIQQEYNKGNYEQPTEPIRFPKERLSDIFKTYGIAGYNLQFMLNTTETDKTRYPLNVDMMIRSKDITYNHTYEIVDEAGAHGNMIAYGTKCLSIDPAGSGADSTGYAVIAIWHGYIAILEVGALGNCASDETIHEFKTIIGAYKINKILVETNYGGDIYCALLKKELQHSGIEGIRNSKQKELRIIKTLEPVILRKQLIIHENVYQEIIKDKTSPYGLYYQMNNITLEKGSLKHDDVLDALAMGVEYYADTLQTDAQKKKFIADEQIRQKELDEFIAQATPLHGKNVNDNRQKFYL